MLFCSQQLLIDSRVNWRVYVTLVLRVDLSSLKRKNCLEIRKSQDLAKDFGATASKAEKKICKTKNCKLYIRNITKLLYLKCKLKERKKKKKDEKKQAERKRLCPESNSRPPTHRAKGLPLGQVEHTGTAVEILLLKALSLIKREFKDIFQKNDCSFDSENPT